MRSFMRDEILDEDNNSLISPSLTALYQVQFTTLITVCLKTADNCSRSLQQITAADHCGRSLRQITAADHCGRSLQQITAADHCSRSLQQITSAANQHFNRIITSDKIEKVTSTCHA